MFRLLSHRAVMSGVLGADKSARPHTKEFPRRLGSLASINPRHAAVQRPRALACCLINDHTYQLVTLISQWKSTAGKHDGLDNDKCTPSFAELVSAAQSKRAKELSSVNYPEVTPSSERFYDRERRGSRNENEEWNEYRGPRTRGPRAPRMKDCKTLEEAINLSFDHLEQTGKMSPSDTSAFWSNIPRLLYKQKQINNNHSYQDKMATRLAKIIERSEKNVQSFKPRYLSEIVLGMAKTAAKLKTLDQRRVDQHPVYSTFHALLCHKTDDQGGIFNRIAVASLPKLPQTELRHLSNQAYAFCLVGYVPKFGGGKSFFDHIAESVLKMKDVKKSQNFSNMVYAYAKLREFNQSLFDAVGNAIEESNDLSTFEPQHLANTVWAFATAGATHSRLFQKVGDEISSKDNHKGFIAQNVSNIVWAFATCGEAHLGLFERVGNEIATSRDLRSFLAQALSNILLAFAKVGASHNGLFQRLGDEVVSRDSLRDFNSQDFANIIWAFATINFRHPKLFQKVGDEIESFKNFKSFLPQHFSNILWAFATMEVKHQGLFQNIGNAIMSMDNLNQFNGQDFSMIVWAYATADVRHPDLFEKVALIIGGLKNVELFNSQNISNIAWAYAKSKHRHSNLFDKLANAAIKKKDQLDPQHVSNLLWSFSTVGLAHHNMFSSLAARARDVIDQCSEQHLGNIAWAYAVSDIEAPGFFNEMFLNACLHRKDQFTEEGLCQLYQWHLWRKELQSDNLLPPSLQKRCYEVFVSRKHDVHKFQKEMAKELRAFGVNTRENVLLGSGYRVNALVEVEGREVAVEISGPHHFVGRNPIGSTILKRRQISQIDGIPVITIPYWEWNGLGKNPEKRQQYLRSKL